jgi:hypothetical protein
MRIATCLCLLVVSFVFSSPAVADSIVNGGFETGNFAGWSTIGDTLVVNSSFGVASTNGLYDALISDAPNDFNSDAPNPGYPFKANFTYSGNISAGAVSPFSPFYSFIGVPYSALFALCGFCDLIDGSALKQSFTAQAGAQVSFDFRYVSNDGPTDKAFAVIDGTLSFIATAPVGCTSYPITPPYYEGSTLSPTGFQYDCGIHSFSTTLTTAGSHSIVVGVIETGDDWINSAVLVDNFVVTAVPEPSTWILLISGLVLVSVFRIRSRAQIRNASTPGEAGCGPSLGQSPLRQPRAHTRLARIHSCTRSTQGHRTSRRC